MISLQEYAANGGSSKASTFSVLVKWEEVKVVGYHKRIGTEIYIPYGGHDFGPYIVPTGGKDVYVSDGDGNPEKSTCFTMEDFYVITNYKAVLDTDKLKLPKESAKRFELKVSDTSFPKVTITSSKDAFEYISMFYGDDIEIYESFFMVMLNQKQETIGYAKVSQGGIVGTVVDVRIVMKYALDALASSIIIAHNHPSGNLKESIQDITITSRIEEACKIMDISLNDHLIISKASYTSFRNEGLLKY